MLEGAAQPPADGAGGAAGADGLAGPFEPHSTEGITGQILAFVVGQQRTQMQRGSALFNVEVHHHRSVLAMRAAGGLGVPARLDQAHKRIDRGRQRRAVPAGPVGTAVVVFPLGDQRIKMRGQGSVERRRFVVGKFDAPAAALVAGGFGD